MMRLLLLFIVLSQLHFIGVILQTVEPNGVKRNTGEKENNIDVLRERYQQELFWSMAEPKILYMDDHGLAEDGQSRGVGPTAVGQQGDGCHRGLKRTAAGLTGLVISHTGYGRQSYNHSRNCLLSLIVPPGYRIRIKALDFLTPICSVGDARDSASVAKLRCEQADTLHIFDHSQDRRFEQTSSNAPLLTTLTNKLMLSDEQAPGPLLGEFCGQMGTNAVLATSSRNSLTLWWHSEPPQDSGSVSEKLRSVQTNVQNNNKCDETLKKQAGNSAGFRLLWSAFRSLGAQNAQMAAVHNFQNEYERKQCEIDREFACMSNNECLPLAIGCNRYADCMDESDMNVQLQLEHRCSHISNNPLNRLNGPKKLLVCAALVLFALSIACAVFCLWHHRCRHFKETSDEMKSTSNGSASLSQHYNRNGNPTIKGTPFLGVHGPDSIIASRAKGIITSTAQQPAQINNTHFGLLGEPQFLRKQRVTTAKLLPTVTFPPAPNQPLLQLKPDVDPIVGGTNEKIGIGIVGKQQQHEVFQNLPVKVPLQPKHKFNIVSKKQTYVPMPPDFSPPQVPVHAVKQEHIVTAVNGTAIRLTANVDEENASSGTLGRCRQQDYPQSFLEGDRCCRTDAEHPHFSRPELAVLKQPQQHQSTLPKTNNVGFQHQQKPPPPAPPQLSSIPLGLIEQQHHFQASGNVPCSVNNAPDCFLICNTNTALMNNNINNDAGTRSRNSTNTSSSTSQQQQKAYNDAMFKGHDEREIEKHTQEQKQQLHAFMAAQKSLPASNSDAVSSSTNTSATSSSNSRNKCVQMFI